MRSLARIGLALAGLALAAPNLVGAAPPAKKKQKAAKTSCVAGRQHHKNIFGWEQLCPDCERAKLRAQGIEIPPPPPIPSGVVMEGGRCASCEAGTTIPVAPRGMGAAPGFAVVGGPAPGYAVVGDTIPSAEPTPIGLVQARPGAQGRPAGGRSAPSDRSVMPTRIASDPIAPGGHNPPHILSHLFGLSGIGRDFREERERRVGQKHASIPYGPEAQPRVTDVPSSVVYSGR